MSDQTIDLAPETDARSTRKPTTEFGIYFAIIFVATLPLACLTWALSIIKSGEIRQRGPIARAWSQARIITPMIFSA